MILVIQIKNQDIHILAHPGLLLYISPLIIETALRADHFTTMHTSGGDISVKYLFVLVIAFCVTLFWQTYDLAERTPNLQSFEQEQVIIRTPQAT